MTYTLEMAEAFECQRTAEDVFDYIVDFSRITQWDHTIISAQKTTPGAVGLGTRFDLMYAMGLSKVPIRYEITEFEPSVRAVLVGKSVNFVATDTLTIAQTQQGSVVNWHARIEFTGTAAKVVPLLKNKIVKAGKQTIKDLASALIDDYPTPKLRSLNALADKLVLPSLISFTKYGYQHARKNWNPVTNNVKGQHIVVTGATSGLGLATAKSLANLGADLTLVARNKQKAQQVRDDISHETGNPNIRLEIADLSEMSELKKLTKRLLKLGKPIDVLVNNAGALFNPRQETSEGIESSFALLLLGPVLLTEQLKPLLSVNGARVINVSSGGMYAKRISVSDLESQKSNYSGSEAYARAKRGLVICGEQWAQQWAADNISVHNMHPGWAQTPGVAKSLPSFNKKAARVLRDASQGADTIIWLATASEVAKTNGLFWLDREPHTTHLLNTTRETAEQRSALFAALANYAKRFDVEIDLHQ